MNVVPGELEVFVVHHALAEEVSDCRVEHSSVEKNAEVWKHEKCTECGKCSLMAGTGVGHSHHNAMDKSADDGTAPV